VLLSLSFVTGGSSQETNAGVMVAQLLAIPVLLYALWEAQKRGLLLAARWSVMVFALVILIPLLQLLPLPEWFWNLPSARRLLQHDLAEAGVTSLQYRWTLSPAATERDLLSLLPAAALFIAALTLGSVAQRRLFWLVVSLSFFGLLLGGAQVGAGQASILNPYPQWAPAMGGVFANPNHQAASIAIALVVSIALMFDVRSRVRRGENLALQPWILGALIAAFVLAIPIVGSRAGPVIAILPVIILVLGRGAFSRDRMRERGTQAILLVAAFALLIGLHAALTWTAGDKVDVIRSALTKQTVSIGVAHAPLGGGIGAFVPLFDQGADVSMLSGEYINAAHNDYAQLWLEGGVIAAACILVVLIWLAVSLRRLLNLPSRSTSRRRGLPAAAGMFVIVLHSAVDYPLRTPALLAVFGLMAGVLAATVARGGRSVAGDVEDRAQIGDEPA
jgi:hypothetical protein